MSKNYTNLQYDENTGVTSVTLDGISFTNIDYSTGTKPIKQDKVAPSNSQYEFGNTTGSKKIIIDAVNIDWNGASICNQTVNTTGQLLSN